MPRRLSASSPAGRRTRGPSPSRSRHSRFERELQRCLRVVQAGRKVPRRVVAQVVHLDKKALDLVEATLVDRGCLTVHVDAVPGRPARTTWEWTP